VILPVRRTAAVVGQVLSRSEPETKVALGTSKGNFGPGQQYISAACPTRASSTSFCKGRPGSQPPALWTHVSSPFWLDFSPGSSCSINLVRSGGTGSNNPHNLPPGASRSLAATPFGSVVTAHSGRPWLAHCRVRGQTHSYGPAFRSTGRQSPSYASSSRTPQSSPRVLVLRGDRRCPMTFEEARAPRPCAYQHAAYQHAANQHERGT
jgi:hypothetical protein